MDNYRKKEIIKAFVAIVIIVIAIFVAFTVVYKYQIEGDKRIPFKLSKLTIVSTVEGIENEGSEEKWNLNIFQNNDIYFSIEKNEDANNEDIIQSVTIENIKINNQPQVGKIVAYMPNSSDGRLFNNAEDTIVDKKLTYRGSNKSDSKTLEIGNQGGTAVIRFSNTGLGKYVSNDDEEIRHDASLLQKLNLNEQQLKCEVSFDFIIKLTDNAYSSKITLNLPCDNLVQQGTSSLELTDNFVFKRIK